MKKGHRRIVIVEVTRDDSPEVEVIEGEVMDDAELRADAAALALYDRIFGEDDETGGRS